MPKGRAKPLPRKPRPKPTYVKKDVMPSKFFPNAACKVTNIRLAGWLLRATHEVQHEASNIVIAMNDPV